MSLLRIPPQVSKVVFVFIALTMWNEEGNSSVLLNVCLLPYIVCLFARFYIFARSLYFFSILCRYRIDFWCMKDFWYTKETEIISITWLPGNCAELLFYIERFALPFWIFLLSFSFLSVETKVIYNQSSSLGRIPKLRQTRLS